MNQFKQNKLRAPLFAELDGPVVENHRIPVSSLVGFLKSIQQAVERITLNLSGKDSSAQAGRRRSGIRNVSSLEVVSIGKGSVSITLDLPQKQQGELYDDLGEQAVGLFVEGIRLMSNGSNEVPNGYDKGVLLALKESGNIFSKGIDKINFTYKSNNIENAAEYTPIIRDNIERLIAKPVENLRVLEGRLLMGDFKETAFRCRLHPPVGEPITCTFDESQKETVLSALTSYVRLKGYSTELEGVIKTFNIQDMDILERDIEELNEESSPLSFYDQPLELEELAKRQRVEPVKDFEKLLGDFWPDDESEDDFLNTLNEWRTERNDGGIDS